MRVKAREALVESQLTRIEFRPWASFLLLLATILFSNVSLSSDLRLRVIDAAGVGPTWDGGIAAFDQEIDFGSCINDFGVGCPNIDWLFVGAGRGQVSTS